MASLKMHESIHIHRLVSFRFDKLHSLFTFIHDYHGQTLSKTFKVCTSCCELHENSGQVLSLCVRTTLCGSDIEIMNVGTFPNFISTLQTLLIYCDTELKVYL